MTVRIEELDQPPRTQLERFRISNFHREVVTAVCDHIKSNLDLNLSLDQLARKSGYSKSHFSRMFRMIHGMSVQKYVVNARMDAAAVLLRDTDQSVEQVMLVVGYFSSSSFAKAFTGRHRRTPTLYRGQARGAAKRAAARAAREDQP